MKIFVKSFLAFFIVMTPLLSFADTPIYTPTKGPAIDTDSTAMVRQSVAAPNLTDSASMDQQAIQNFKDWFNLDVKKEDIIKTALKTQADYYANFKACKPGSYRAAMINDIYGQRDMQGNIIPMLGILNAHIFGMENGKCHIVIQPDTVYDSDCRFDQDSLNFIAASKIGEGAATPNKGPTFKKFGQILISECTRKHASEAINNHS